MKYAVPFAVALALGACSSTKAGSPVTGDPPPDAGVDPACAAGKTPPPPTCPGVTAPTWKLEDFQPRSAGFHDKYGPAEMRGKPLMVVLIAAWCPYCQAQVGRMEALRNELRDAGVDVNIVGVNDIGAAGMQNELTSRTIVPLFQDVQNANGATIDTAYQLHGGHKDDVYIYRPTGELFAYYRGSSSVKIDLTTPEGYKNIKDTLLAAR